MKVAPVLWYTALIIMIVGMIYILTELRGDHVVDARTRDLCMEYAMKDHSLEIGLERFKELSKLGDPNDHVFFYNSCINHVKCPTVDDCRVDNKYMKGNK